LITQSQTDDALPIPAIQLRDFVFGLITMQLMNLLLYCLFLSAVPFLILVIGGFAHSSIFKIRILFIIAILVGVSLATNGVVIGTWCLRRLVRASVNYKIGIMLGMLLLYLLVIEWGQPNYLDAALLLFGLSLAIRDKALGRR
jgi:hypothetical protein